MSEIEQASAAAVNAARQSEQYAVMLAAVQQAAQQQQPQVVHIHQAPPDRTVQRLALGSGMGAGTVAAGVYFGPLLVAALTSMAVDLAVVALVITVCAWGVVTVVRSIGGPDGKAAVKTLQSARRGPRR